MQSENLVEEGIEELRELQVKLKKYTFQISKNMDLVIAQLRKLQNQIIKKIKYQFNRKQEQILSINNIISEQKNIAELLKKQQHHLEETRQILSSDRAMKALIRLKLDQVQQNIQQNIKRVQLIIKNPINLYIENQLDIQSLVEMIKDKINLGLPFIPKLEINILTKTFREFQERKKDRNKSKSGIKLCCNIDRQSSFYDSKKIIQIPHLLKQKREIS